MPVMSQVLNSLIYAALGIAIFVTGFWIIDLLTPYKLWREIVEQKNIALAILLGSFAIAIGLIVAAAVHG